MKKTLMVLAVAGVLTVAGLCSVSAASPSDMSMMHGSTAAAVEMNQNYWMGTDSSAVALRRKSGNDQLISKQFHPSMRKSAKSLWESIRYGFRRR